MASPVTVRGVTILWPTTGDKGYSDNALQLQQLLASAVLPINGLYNSTTGHVGNLALDNTDNLTINGQPIIAGPGSSGYSGFSGYSGANGSIGVNGASGYSGFSGANGSIGVNGASGYSGFSGMLKVWTTVSTTTLAVKDSQYLCDTTAGSWTLTLPASPALGDLVVITDNNNFAINNLIVDGNGHTFDGQPSPLTIDIGRVTVTFTYNGSTWRVVATAGPMGISGYSGATGPIGTGTSGYSGVSGASTSGYSGASGQSGYSGIGTSGYSGATGPQGISGYSGASGISGYSGASGTTGSNGVSGYSGASGTSGYSGASGTSGYSGASGTSGYSGTNGTIGVDGVSGYSGASGTSGFSGYSGSNATAAGVAAEIQYNDGAGGFAASPNLTFSGGNLSVLGEYHVSSGSALQTYAHFSPTVMNGASATATNNAPNFTFGAGSGGLGNTNGGDLILLAGNAAGIGNDGNVVINSGSANTGGFIQLQNLGLDLKINTNGSLSINSNTGTVGQLLTSAGPAAPPAWSSVVGTSGYSGASGTSGFSGYSGASGTSGYSGASGISGYSGISGASTSGYSGASGTSGFSGYSGASGTSGYSGASGTSGYSGASGTSGYSGASGTSGFSGISGHDGGSAGRIYYPENSVASDITGYKVASAAPSGNAQSNIAVTLDTGGIPTFMGSFATSSTQPNVTSLPAGTALRYIYAWTSSGTVAIRTDLFRYNAAGNEATSGARTDISFNLGALTITRVSGSFITDGFTQGARITVSGSTGGLNDGNWTIQTVSALIITLIQGSLLTTQIAGPAITITTKEKLLRTGNTPTFTNTTVQLQEVTYSDPTAYPFALADRIIFKWWGIRSAGNPTMTIATEGVVNQSYIVTTINAGAAGSSGFSGFSGYSGISGASTSGYSGYSGGTGSNGTSGYSGYSGATGTSGYSGAPSTVADLIPLGTILTINTRNQYIVSRLLEVDGNIINEGILLIL